MRVGEVPIFDRKPRNSQVISVESRYLDGLVTTLSLGSSLRFVKSHLLAGSHLADTTAPVAKRRLRLSRGGSAFGREPHLIPSTT